MTSSDNTQNTQELAGVKELGYGYVMGYDPAYKSDYGVVQVWKKPSRLRKLLRRIGLDKSKWEYQLYSEEIIR